MPFYDLTQVKSKTLATGVQAFPAWGEGIMMVRVELAPHSRVPEHTHPHEQAGIVLEGELDFSIGEESRHLRQGDAYLVPSGVPHSATAGDSQALVLDIFNPPREDYKP